MQNLQFSTNVTSLSVSYAFDPDVEFIQQVNPTEHGIRIFDCPVAADANDATARDYSVLTLTSQKRINDILTTTTLDASVKKSITTTLASNKYTDAIGSPLFVYFNNNNETSSQRFDRYTSATCVSAGQIVTDAQRFFNVELLDSNYARVSFVYNSDHYYLTVTTTQDVVFTSVYSTDSVTTDISAAATVAPWQDFDDIQSVSAIDATIFRYFVNDNKLLLLKPTATQMLIIAPVSGADGKFKLGALTTAQAPDMQQNVFTFRNYIKTVSFDNIDASWTSYDISNLNEINLDESKTATNLTNNFIVDAQYNNIQGNALPANLLMLKNQLSRDNIANKGDYTKLFNATQPGVQYRDYTSFAAGVDCENNAGEIAVNYTYYSIDYIAKPDEYTLFSTADSMYPYSVLNVNDSSISQNGAIGASYPYLADKIFKKDYFNPDNAFGLYLCTWLSAGSINSPAIWMDRYYNPQITTAGIAMQANSPAYNSSAFSTISSVSGLEFFDKISDVAFEPSEMYFYNRIGNNLAKQHISANIDSTSLINQDILYKDANANVVGYTDADGLLDATFTGQVDANVLRYNDTASVGQMTMSFWLGADDWTKINAYQILGNLTDHGFGVIRNPVVTPFITIQSRSAVNFYNSDLQLVATTPVSASFANNVFSVVQFEGLNDLFAVHLNGTIARLHADGTLISIANPANDTIVNVATDKQHLYLLLRDQQTVVKYNIYTRQSETIRTNIIDPATNAVSPQISSIKANSIIIKDAVAYGFNTDAATFYTSEKILSLSGSNIIQTAYDYRNTETLFSGVSSTINAFATDSQNNIYIGHDSNVTAYDATRTFVFTQTLSSVTNDNCTVKAINSYYDYTNDVYNHNIIAMVVDTQNNMHLVKLNASTGSIVAKTATNIPYNGYAVYNLTNFNHVNQQYKNRTASALTFAIQNIDVYNYSNSINLTIDFDAAKLNSGYHHFALQYDAYNGNLALYVNGILVNVQQFSEINLPVSSILDDGFTIGSCYLRNSVKLSSFLKQSNKFYASNCSIKDFRLFSRSIDFSDIRMLMFAAYRSKNLVFQLPGGQRNNLDRISKLFSAGSPGFKSNKVKIYVKNLDINSNDLKSRITTAIVAESKKILPATVDITGVEFVDFK